jgi:hypothetical protein
MVARVLAGARCLRSVFCSKLQTMAVPASRLETSMMFSSSWKTSEANEVIVVVGTARVLAPLVLKSIVVQGVDLHRA